MGLAQTYRRLLHERALEQYGYITTADAAELGVPGVEVRKIAARGGLTRRGFGLYRFDDIPVSDHDQFMEAVLAAGSGAFLIAESVLDLHGLGLVNPQRIKVGTRARVRRHTAGPIKVVRMDPVPVDLTVYEGVPSLTIARALLDCRGRIMGERLIAAAHDAQARGLFTRREAREVLEALGAPTAAPWSASAHEAGI